MIRRNGHKYHAQQTVVLGIRFDSKLEAKRYQELILLAKAGELRDLVLQPQFPLHTSKPNQMAIGVYRADFAYDLLDKTAYGCAKWDHVIEDAKGFDVPLQAWKRKHAETLGIDECFPGGPASFAGETAATSANVALRFPRFDHTHAIRFPTGRTMMRSFEAYH